MTPIHARIVRKFKFLAEQGIGEWIDGPNIEPIGLQLYAWVDERCTLLLGSEGLVYTEDNKARTVSFGSVLGIEDHMTVAMLVEMSRAKNPQMPMQLDILTASGTIVLRLPYLVAQEFHPLMHKIADAKPGTSS